MIKNINSFLFIFLFILQQMFSFMFANADLVTPYWLVIYFLVFVLAFNLPIFSKRFKNARIFTVILIFSMIPMIIKGDFSLMMQLSLFWIIGYIGYVFINSREINIKLFDIVFIVFYVYFYFIYFRYKEILVNVDNEGDLFGHSSSNTIAMSLNMLFFFYYYLSKHYSNINVTNKLFLFSILNVVFIAAQGSRAGLVVAVMFLVILLIDKMKTVSKQKRIVLFVLLTIIAFFGIYANILSILNYMTENAMIKKSSEFETEIRFIAIMDFFDSLNINRFLCGYPFGHIFAYSLTRTFNCYLDIWCFYGFFAFVIVMLLIAKRIMKNRFYYDSLWIFVPILLYGVFESFMSTGLWQLFWYLMFFQFNKINYYESTNIVKEIG